LDAYSPWVKVDDRVTALTPAVGRFAFSPSGRYLAWVEGPAMARLHVTALDSLRTVCTLDDPGAFALAWAGDDELRVVRAVDRAVIASRHGLPDGGALGAVTMPRDSFGMRAGWSADGRVALVHQASYHRAKSAARAFLVGARGDDVATELALAPATPEGRGPFVPPAPECALSPDGHRVAVVLRTSPHGEPLARFVDAGGARVAEVPLPRGEARVLGWASPTALLFHNGATLLRADLDGSCTHVATLPAGTAVDDLDLHPERDRLLLRALRAGDGARYRTLALHVPLGGAPAAAITLSGDRSPESGMRDGGACWDAAGAILTLTQSPPGVANLARRDAPGAPGRRLAKFGLPGERPHELTLAASPSRTRFLATWKAFDRGPADPVRRLMLLDVP